MAATVKPIEAKSVHQIQSGQVIVDLCSVVKELVENSLDAGASAIEVRFKNNGLDEIEVQDNGDGIAAVNYENVALKHYTSKLSTYDDLLSLQTFGFRGEALSSLCALSTFTVTTAQAHEAPKGHKLEFEVSGKLKETSIVACQKGSTASVQNLFEKLPVRRKELSKNIKREYGKVMGLLHAYACISVNVKFTVKNAMPKAKSMTVFATKSNATTRENIANVYGAKALSALAALDLELDFAPASSHSRNDEINLKKVIVQGHISKPVFGEGRQTPDRQMFFVNGRPCGLPQIAKAINEVYKSFNVSQSPFIFADFQMDTSAYDVNVSPDKRTILLHDATALIEKLKVNLTELFDGQDQTVPQSQMQSSKLPGFKPLNVQRELSTTTSQKSSSADLFAHDGPATHRGSPHGPPSSASPVQPSKLLHDHFSNLASSREETGWHRTDEQQALSSKERERRALKIAKSLAELERVTKDIDEYDDVREKNELSHRDALENDKVNEAEEIQVRDFNARLKEQQAINQLRAEHDASESIYLEPSVPTIKDMRTTEYDGVVPNAFDRMRPKRVQPDIATITIGDKTVTRIIGSQTISQQRRNLDPLTPTLKAHPPKSVSQRFAHQLQKFNVGEGENREDDGPQNESEAGSVSDEHKMGEETPTDLTAVGETKGYRDSSPHSKAAYETLADRADDGIEGESVDQARIIEEHRVAELIRSAESTFSEHNKKTERRVGQALKGTGVKDSAASLLCDYEVDIDDLNTASRAYWKMVMFSAGEDQTSNAQAEVAAESAEEQLSLTISKSDFSKMRIVGQFNLGFIIAVRPKSEEAETSQRVRDELFIIDQHASDEKYNFERLQLETTVGNQRLVRPALLDLTAVEEEIVIDNKGALEKNGFVVDVDTSGEQEVGRRCRLTTLPLSKEVTFGVKDLDELIHLLADSPMLSESSFVPRPSKVRKMFAMRACRSSIMIGKTLSQKQMSTIVQHMGSIDKPWNCPHGRPTMRHLASLDKLESGLWIEGDGVYPGGTSRPQGSKSAANIWKTYADA